MQQQQQEGTRFFIPGLPEQVTDEEISAHFSFYGTVNEAIVARDKATGASRGFGYVTISGVASPNTVLNDAHALGGKEIRVVLTKESLAGSDDKRVYIGGTGNLSVDDIRDAFSNFGQVWDVHTPKDAMSGRRKNFSFVTFATTDAFQRAVATGLMNLRGLALEVKPATKDDDRIPFNKGKGKGKSDWGWESFDPWASWGWDFGGWGAGGGWGEKGGGKGKAKSSTGVTPPSDGVTFFVQNVPEGTNPGDLAGYFSAYGQVKNVNIVPEKPGASARAYVTIADVSKRDAILSDTHVFAGAQLSVMLSKDNLGTDLKKVHLDNCEHIPLEAIREVFSSFGPVLDVHAPKDAWTGERKRFAFVTFGSDEAMQNAIRAGSVVIGTESIPVKAATQSGGAKGGGMCKGGKGKGAWDPWSALFGSWGGDSWGGDSWGKGGGKDWGMGAGGWGGMAACGKGDAKGKGKGDGSFGGGMGAWADDWSGGKGAAWGGKGGCRFGPY